MQPGRRTQRSLLLLAGGRASRFGGLKQLAPVGPAGEPVSAYTLHDAARAGFQAAIVVCPPGLGARMLADLSGWCPVGLHLRTVEQERPTARDRPWGTAHALLAAAPELAGARFAVANADDHYGRAAIASASALLDVCDEREQGVVGYRLRRTMEHTDGVSRGLCIIADDRLVRVEERFDVRRDVDGRGFLARDRDGASEMLGAEAIVSMNLWLFTPTVLEPLQRLWDGFLATEPHDDAEFMIPDVVNTLIGQGVRFRVGETDARAFGLTRRRDVPRVREVMAELVADGTYPADLRDAGHSGA